MIFNMRKSVFKYILFLFIFIGNLSLLHSKTFACEINIEQTIDRLEKHWWGYRRYVSNDQISRCSTKFDLMAAEFSLAGGLTIPISFLNPIAGLVVSSVLDLSSSYFWLLSTYIQKINKGNGVMIDFSKGIIFKIKPL